MSKQIKISLNTISLYEGGGGCWATSYCGGSGGDICSTISCRGTSACIVGDIAVSCDGKRYYCGYSCA